MRVAHGMALASGLITSVVVMVEQEPDLSDKLNLQTVPVTFLGQSRLDGPQNEWILAQRLRLR